MPVSTREDRRQQRKLDREEAQRRSERSAKVRRNRLIGGGVAILVLGCVALGISLSRRAPDAPLPGQHSNDPTTAAGQLYQHIPATQAITYDHYPPNHGNHYDTPRPWAAYDTQVPDGYFVHNLEHGGIVVLYHCPTGCAATVTQLKGLFNTLPKDHFGEVKLVVSPYDKTTHQITLLAWDYEQDLDSFDLKAIQAFYNGHVDQAPEKIP